MNNFSRSSPPNSPTFTEPIVPPSMIGRVTLFLAQFILFVFVLHTTDFVLFLLNIVTPSKAKGTVVPRGFSPARPPPVTEMPVVFQLCAVARMLGKERSPDWIWQWTNWRGIGHSGDWGDSRLEPGWSRSPCPAINALAQCDILPRDGRHITPMQCSAALARAYNLSPTLAIQLMAAFEPLFRDRGWFDLEDLGAQNVVQHDGSITREDANSPWAKATVAATQGTPSQRLLDLYLPQGTRGEINWQNHSRMLAQFVSPSNCHSRAGANARCRSARSARKTSRNRNGQFILSPRQVSLPVPPIALSLASRRPLSIAQYLFASGNAALMDKVVGGRIDTLRPWLGGTPQGYEECIRGFEPQSREGWGIARSRPSLSPRRGGNADLLKWRQSILSAQGLTLLIEGGTGGVDGTKRFEGYNNAVEANLGWNAMLGEPGDEARKTQ
ncbi:SPOSA6832_03122, partial [Sporobolomyces salmonicolor]